MFFLKDRGIDGDRGSTSEAYEIHRQDERMAWLRRRVRGVYNRSNWRAMKILMQIDLTF